MNLTRTLHNDDDRRAYCRLISETPPSSHPRDPDAPVERLSFEPGARVTIEWPGDVLEVDGELRAMPAESFELTADDSGELTAWA
ncbi:hypothetical protein [Allobranchiibius sp. GilTou38]|uniref:hypothetical protein n=1 Tax=Allobranchiibius sp. GilTou38 TaxID=2815210 RepID=UPI001AA153BE|nr:hypothetical protein [Allobranchiibius sp. GilTou38]MBO1765782.1 hypothetical protein [Allobranchiibius sp. GilTou38]